jgi:hypothetical protein
LEKWSRESLECCQQCLRDDCGKGSKDQTPEKKVDMKGCVNEASEVRTLLGLRDSQYYIMARTLVYI